MQNPYIITHCNIIRNHRIKRNETIEEITENFVNFAAFIKSLYKKESVNYPKFYKMDNLGKLGFMAAEMIFKESPFLERYKREDIGIVIQNSSSSLDTDKAYNETIRDRSNYFPSPSVFVYTLPNILIGEICIRHGIKGENAFLLSAQFDPGALTEAVSLLLDKDRAQACLCGWVEVLGDRFESVLFLVEKKNMSSGQGLPTGTKPFTMKSLTEFYQI